MRTYELMFVVDPRVADEDVVAMTQDYRHLIETGGLTITKEENWGRRKLAYTIDKVTEGKYILFYIQSEDGTTRLHEVEHRMRQNDKVHPFLDGADRSRSEARRLAGVRRRAARPADRSHRQPGRRACRPGCCHPSHPSHPSQHRSRPGSRGRHGKGGVDHG